MVDMKLAAFLSLALIGCSATPFVQVDNTFTLPEAGPSPEVDATAEVQGDAARGDDSSTTPGTDASDAAMVAHDAGSDVAVNDAHVEDVIVDVVAPIDAHDAAPDHVGSVYCATPIGLYIGCDGQAHYDFDLTTPTATCPAGKGAIASCSPGDQCVVHLTADNTYHVGVCQ